MTEAPALTEDLQNGARNLLLGCVGVKPGEATAIVLDTAPSGLSVPVAWPTVGSRPRLKDSAATWLNRRIGNT